MKSEEQTPLNPPQSSSDDSTEKKPWRPLHLKVLDVPRSTQGGTFKLDPVEDFFLYRTS